MERKVYLDSVLANYVNGEVMQEMMPMFNSNFACNFSEHFMGREAKFKVDEARVRVAKSINAKPSEIIFTSCEEESNTLAIKGLAYANKAKGNHIITSKIEDASILNACKELENEGFRVTYLNVDETGLVKLSELMHYLCEDTILVSITACSKEIGTIQALKALSLTCKEREGIIFHTNCSNVFSHIKIDVEEMGIDALTVSSNQIYGPKGASCLFVKKGVKISNLICGGSEENGKRPGELNIPAIVGFGKATEIAVRDMFVTNTKLKKLRDYLQQQLTEKIPGIKFNGHNYQRVPHILNISFETINSECITTLLDLEGVCVFGDGKINYVLDAMGLSKQENCSSVRFSISKSNNKEDIDFAVNKIVKIVNDLKEISPLQIKGGK